MHYAVVVDFIQSYWVWIRQIAGDHLTGEIDSSSVHTCHRHIKLMDHGFRCMGQGFVQTQRNTSL